MTGNLQPRDHHSKWSAGVGRAGRVLGFASLLTLVAAPSIAFAGADHAWQQSDDLGGGMLPGASFLFGAIGAAFLVVQGVKSGATFGEHFMAVVLGFSFGVMLGLPIGCMLR